MILSALLLATAFEKIALVDNLDFATLYDIETEKGTIEMIDSIVRSHPTALAMRDKSGGKPRFPSAEEAGISAEEPFDKRRICREDTWGWLRLDRSDVDATAVAFAECERRGLRRMIHATFEEAHWAIELIAPWNFEHPQYWCRTRDGVPWAGHVSLAHPDVRAHKLRYLDELLARKPEAVFLDFWRCGGWSVAKEYVQPVLDRWAAKHGDEPAPRDAKDPRWRALVAEDIMGYLREYGRKCHAAGARLLIGFKEFDREDRMIAETYAIDWKALARDGTIDGFVVMGVKQDYADPFGEIRRTLEYAKANLGKAALYSAVTMYNMRKTGIPEIAKHTGLTNGEVAKRLLGIAKDVGCAGVVLECVDDKNYPADVNDALRD